MPFVKCQHCGAEVFSRRIYGPKGRKYCNDTCRKRADRAREKASQIARVG